MIFLGGELARFDVTWGGRGGQAAHGGEDAPAHVWDSGPAGARHSTSVTGPVSAVSETSYFGILCYLLSDNREI